MWLWEIKDLTASPSSSICSSSSPSFSPTFPSLGLLVGLGGGGFAGQRHALVAVPQFVELRGLVLAAAGAAVPETGQGRPHLHAFHRHRALDGFAELDGERQRRLEKIEKKERGSKRVTCKCHLPATYAFYASANSS